jgi:hypothetical protein
MLAYLAAEKIKELPVSNSNQAYYRSLENLKRAKIFLLQE